ncbi:MAG: Heterodisulfide reductase, cytochrome reductase subunit [Labilithrix sp.]|nr:Heterodisulfide reductase, cytochrome reductase subunit [Labilithrix sp.]
MSAVLPPPSPSSFPAVLTERRDSGAGLSLVTLTPEHERALAYRAPGQYIEVRAASNGYFVLAGEIGAPSWELLVRTNGGASDALTTAPEGTVFDVVGPLGKGFPLERTHGRALVVAVAGSALAVTRPILRDRIARREGPLTSVYIGARTAADVALSREVAGWVHAGARVVVCLSRPDIDDAAILAEARRATGYVQSVLRDDVAEGLIAEGLVFAAGPKGMMDELRDLSSRAPALEVITNA